MTSTSNEIIIKQVVSEIKNCRFERNRKYIPYKDTRTRSCTWDYRWMLRNAGELGARMKMAAHWLPNIEDFFKGFPRLLETSENNLHSATYDNSSAPSSLFQKVAIWQPLTVKWSPSPDFHQNFGRQKFFPLAMATKMVAAFSAEFRIIVLPT